MVIQVEYYLSDENLPHDQHLLALTGGSKNLPVSVSRICGFKKMRQYKPPALVKASLKKSTFLEFTDDKHIRRRIPLSIKPTVAPEAIDMAPKPNPDTPWITKGMLKPTGFEPNYADAPITPGDFEKEKELYEEDLPFTTRIETAIGRFKSRRKFHQETAQIFSSFLSFGGINSAPKQFTGGLSKAELEERTADEIAAITATDYVSEAALNENKWAVDFPGVAASFLYACPDILLWPS